MSPDRTRTLLRQACIAAATAIAVLTITGLGWLHAQDSDFEATAIVGPVDLDVNPVRVARIVSALNRGPHPRRDDGIEFSIRPFTDSRLTLVTASGDDPNDVALAANERAVALVETLNDAGEGVGVFTVSSRAVPPRARVRPPGAASSGVMGVVALVCLTVAVRGFNMARSAPRQTAEAT